MVSASSSGTITFRAQWVGGSTAPQYLDLLMLSSVQYSYLSPGSGSAYDGIGGSEAIESIRLGVSGQVSSKKIRRFKPSLGMVEFSYSPSASSQSTGYYSNCGASAMWANFTAIDRGVSLVSTSHPGTYRKTFTGQNEQFIHTDWSGEKIIPFPKAIREQNPTVYTATGQLTEAIVALDLKELNSNDDPPPNWEHERVRYQGSVVGLDEGTYKYEGASASISEHLPSGILANGWNILPYEYWVFSPIELNYSGVCSILNSFRSKFNSKSYPGSTEELFTTKFTYKWDSDGAEANAEVKLHFKLPLERQSPVGTYEEELEPDLPPPVPFPNASDPYSPFNRHGSFQTLIFLTGNVWASNQSSHEQAKWDSVNITWVADNKSTAEKVKAASGAVGLIPKAKVAATAVGVFTDLYAKFWPHSQTFGVNKIETFLRQKAFHMHMIYPMPATCPTEAELSRYEWKLQRRQLYKVSLFADDKYGKDGYAGQVVGWEYDLGSAGFDQRLSLREVGYGGGV